MKKEKEDTVKIEDLEDFPGEFITGFVRAAIENDEVNMEVLGKQIYNQLSYCYELNIEVKD